MAQVLKSGHIQLGAYGVKVCVVPKLLEREGIYGDVSFTGNKIRLAGDAAETKKVDALLHEIVHFLLESSNLACDSEESIVSTLAGGLTRLFRDNPEWIRMVLKIFSEEAKCPRKSTRKRKQTTRGAQKRKPQRSHKATRPT